MQLSNVQEKEIKNAIEQYGEIVLIKNVKDDIIIMSLEEYKNNIMRKEIIDVLKESEEEIERGEGIESDEAFKELRRKYGY